MENNNAKGIFYGVIGVATLIVAIIGATFAYFSATTISGQYVTGTAATAGLAVNVTRLTTFSAGEVGKTATDASYVLVPQLDATLDQAIVGTGSNGTNTGACIDANGSLVCTIYKITVTNTGSSAIDISGKIQFYTGPADKLAENAPADGTKYEDQTGEKASIMNHLKWARLANPATVSGNAIPTELLDYSDTDQIAAYKALRPVTLTSQGYANSSATQYLYGRVVASDAKDLYGTDYTNGMTTTAAQAAWITSHQAHTDLIDPTDDLTRDAKVWSTNAAATDGSVHLQAAGSQADANNDGVKDDTATFYIVVWISENLDVQNELDKGTFVGQVTFNSAGGSGATSTFTEVAQG